MEPIELTPRALELIRFAHQNGLRVKIIIAAASHPVKCTNCNDTGIVSIVIEDGYPGGPDGRKSEIILPGFNYALVDREDSPCPRCQDLSKFRDRLWKDSRLELYERDWRVDFCAGMPGKEIAVITAQNMLGGLPRPTGLIYYYGDYGTGKSGILKAVVAQSIDSDVPAIYVRAYDILFEIRSTFQGKTMETESSIIQRYSSIPLLAIDEADRIKGSDWEMVTLQRLLDFRYSRRYVMATLLASNKNPESLGEGWEYLVSRLKDADRVPIGGVDLRGR